MKLKIEKGIARGRVQAPPSKSYAHRILIASALAGGESVVSRVSRSEDVCATLDCIRALGIDCELFRGKATFKGKKAQGDNRRIFNCRESGSTLRFFIPIALLSGGVSEFRGTERLISRGISVYDEIFKGRNIKISYEKEKIILDGKLTPGEFNVRGDVSSQFITGLMLALPLLDGDSVINIITDLESKPYIDITVDVLSRFGIEISENKNSYYIKGNQKYKPQNMSVEGDFSNSAFLHAFNLLGGDVSVMGLRYCTQQGDRLYLELFKQIENGKIEADISSCPDLAPILFALSGVKQGGRFTGTMRLKIKESDRAEVMAAELKKFGIELKIDENLVEVNGEGFHAPTEELCGHNDHRIVMALAVISTITGATINGCEAVKKSYPNFFEAIKRLGVEVKNEIQ
jgi:3-phosphoshikimate 1-carboxyvinyltransferase